MTERKADIFFLTGIFAASFFFCGMVLLGSYRWSEGRFYERIAAVAASHTGEEEAVMRALKDAQSCDIQAGKELLGRYGYEGRLPAGELYPVSAAVSFLFAAGCTAAFFLYASLGRGRLKKRTEELTRYLRQVEEGDYTLLPERGQDLFSNLEDEIYKTVLALRESRERLGREKERLAENLADISHQLKTPLTSVSVLSELLERHTAGTGDAGLARRIGEQTDRMAGLTAALLTVSRADAGVLEFVIRDVPASGLIGCGIASVAPLLEKKGQRAVAFGERGAFADFLLACDPGWTGEALANLLKNASEHAPEGTDIGIRAWDNPVFSAIAVEDEGPGFAPEELHRVFERFYRGKNAGKDSAGIGLYLARSLVEAQKGELRAENRREGGARFLIKFYKHI